MSKTNDTKRGLYQKWITRRTDGSSDVGRKHSNCECFVLDLDHDPFSREALLAYVNACEAEFPLLAEDIRAEMRRR